MHGRYIAEPRQAARKDMGVRNYIVLSYCYHIVITLLLLLVVNIVIVINIVIIVSIIITAQ